MFTQKPSRRAQPAVRSLARTLTRCLALALPALAIATLVSFVPGPVMAAGVALGPTVKEVIEFTRIVEPTNLDEDALREQVSPDGQRAFITTRKADVAADKNLFEILLLDVAADHLAAGRPLAPQRLLTIEARRDSDYFDPSIQDARWVGNHTIAFRGRVQGQPIQVYALDTTTRKMTQLTFEAHGLVSFDVSDDLRRVVYVAPVPHPARSPGAQSVVVGNHSFWSVNFGQNDLRAQQRRYRYLVAEAGSHDAARPLGADFAESSGRYPRVSISPDGRWAVLPRYEPDRQLAWGRLYPVVGQNNARFAPALAQDPLSYYSRPYSYVTRRQVAYRLSDGLERVVVDAPDDSRQGTTSQSRRDRLWRADGSSVVIAGTFLPPGSVEDGARKTSSHIIEYWPDSGRWKAIAALENLLIAAHPLAGTRDGFVAVDGGKRRRFERTADGDWRELNGDVRPQDAGTSGSSAQAAWTLTFDEASNSPPDVVATGPAGRHLKLTNLNPQYSPASWGTMRPYAWKDAAGRSWDGGLMVPSNFDPTVRHALVIQTYDFSPARFYLDGPNSYYGGSTSGFAGRAFLRENILVLALPWSASSGPSNGEHEAIGAFIDGVRAAIDTLVREGSVDRERIGIIGWSATGERVLNLVTFSDAPIRAASIHDGDANTLFSMTVTYAVKDGIQSRKEATNQGSPFGESLARWVRNDPSLHTDCVNAALRIESYGPLVQNNWDLYALLRRQYKPAEMVVIPGGAHSLSQPGERMISLQGNVDWYRFWLQGEERSEVVLAGETDATLKDQYARWRQMAQLKRADDAKSRCERVTSGGAF